METVHALYLEGQTPAQGAQNLLELTCNATLGGEFCSSLEEQCKAADWMGQLPLAVHTCSPKRSSRLGKVPKLEHRL